MQSEREQMGYLSQLEEVEECESTENELQAENAAGKRMEVTVIKNINKSKFGMIISREKRRMTKHP